MILLTRHLDHIRQQPEHIRRQVALSVAAVVTGVIALIWLGASVATGVFALKNTSFAEATSGVVPQVAQTGGGLSNLVGAAGAALTGASQGPARIEVVDVEPPTAAGAHRISGGEPTILPF